MMKKHIFIASIIALIFSLSCDTDLQEQSRKEKTAHQTGKPLQFEGLSVRHRYKTPDDYIDDTKSKDRPLAGAYGGQVSLADFSMKDVAEAAEKCFKNYPFPSKAKNYQTDFTMIKGDFPNMTEKDIIKNETTIEKYYDINLDYEVLQLLKKTKTPITKKEKRLTPRVGLDEDDDPVVVPSGSGGSGSSYDPNCKTKMGGYDNTFLKYSCVATKLASYGQSIIPLVSIYNYSRAVYSLIVSAREAKKQFGGGYDNEIDAKRHIYFSALLARNYYTVSSKVPRLQFSKAVGDANEECGANNTDAAQMDYHNNAIGRKLFDDKTTYKTYKLFWDTVTVTWGLNLPSYATLKKGAKNLVDNHKIHINANKMGMVLPSKKKDTICWRKYKIQQVNSRKPVVLKMK